MAEAFLKVMIDKLSSLIQKEIGLIMGVDSEMKKLSSTLTTIQAVLEDAEDKQIKDKSIRDWLCKLNCLAYEIDDIFDECETRVSRLSHTRSKLSRCSLHKILYEHEIGRRMKKVTEKLDAIAAEKDNLHLREMPLDISREVSAASHETGSLLNESDKIYGREDDVEKIVKMLVDDVREKQEISVLPIIGVGGLGKTTLARLVFKDKRVVEHFGRRLWVCVSDNFEIKTLVKAMIESATVTGKASDLRHLDALQQSLWELLSQKRYLLVLDDVWNDQQEKWFELRDILSCGSTGASIIVTTRQKKVADIMGTLPAHCLKGLSDEHCWTLLKQRAFGQEEEVCPKLEVIGKQIVRKCSGVPLAAKALGGILRFKRREEEWIKVEESDIWKLSPEDTLILPALRLSYHHLPLELRQCFAYFAAFDKDKVIPKQDLVLLWMAHGYISDEDVGNERCNELLLRSLLEQSENYKGCIIMHDLVHDLAQSVMENKVPGIQIERNITNAFTIRQVNLEYRHVFFPKSFQQDMHISSILELTSLRVLDASFTTIKDLPRSIRNLKHLRYLNLSRSEIRTLPNSLCSLWNLQILNLDLCRRLVSLPKNIICLHNLRHLRLEYCESLSQMPSRIGELSGLKTLSTFVVGLKKGNQLKELQCLNLGGILEIRRLERVKDHMDARKANIAEKKNLRKLSLSWERSSVSKLAEDVDEKVLEALQPHTSLEYLHISGFMGRNFPAWMTNSTLGKIVEIKIYNCQNCLHLPKLGELPHLKTLSLINLAVENIIEEDFENGNPVEIQFGTLESLYLEDLPNVKGFSNKHESKEAFPNLKELRIVGCSSLILPPLSSLQKLKDLRCSSSTLALFSEQQDTLTRLSVDIEENMTCFPIEMLVKFSNLRELNIRCAKEISVTGEGPQALKKLHHFCIKDCETLTCLPEGLFPHLTALEILSISNCPELVELPEEIKHLRNLDHISLNHLSKMACFTEALQHLTSLRSLFLSELPRLASVPEQLTSLCRLYLFDCTKVVSLPALPNLKDLCVKGCPELERRCKRGSGEDWHKIAHIPRLLIG